MVRVTMSGRDALTATHGLLSALAEQPVLCCEHQPYRVLSADLARPALSSVSTWADLLAPSRSARPSVRLRFVTPAIFTGPDQDSPQSELFPQPLQVFSGLLDRWSNLGGPTLSPGILPWLQSYACMVADYRLRAGPIALDGMPGPAPVCLGWQGWVAYTCREPQPEFMSSLQSLARLACATRQATSDGRVGRKVNMTIRGARFAVLLAYIGAMRFLRAQPVKGDCIAYSVPVAPALTLGAGSARPLLWPRDEDDPEEALLLQALDLASGSARGETLWRALLYQVLQAQGKQAAISRSRGALDVARLLLLESRTGGALPEHWQRLLRAPKRERPCDLGHLVSALVTGQRQEWEAHLRDVAQAELARGPREKTDDPAAHPRLYSIDEVKEVSATMESSHPTPLSVILEGKDGTVRFGHALRQLRENAPSMAREVLEDLETIKTRDQLLDALTRALQWCEVMKAKSPFMIVPVDLDLKLLLEDVERYGPQSIAALLRLLSTLHNAPRRGELTEAGNAHKASESPEPGAQEAPGDAEQME